MVGCFTWILNKSLYLGQVWIYIYIYFPGHIFSNFIGNFQDSSSYLLFLLIHGNSQILPKDWAFCLRPGLCLGAPFCLSGLSQHGSPLFFRPFFNELHGCSEKNNCRHWSRHEPSRVKAACCGQETHGNFAPFFWKRSVTHEDAYEDS